MTIVEVTPIWRLLAPAPSIEKGVDTITRYRLWCASRRLEPSFIARRESVLRRVEQAIGVPLTEATTEQLSEWFRARRGFSDATAYIYTGHLRAYFAWCVDEGLVTDNPARRLQAPRRPRYLPRPIADEPLARAILTANARQRVILALACLAGLRSCEIARLRREDVHEHRQPPVLTVDGKGNKPRVVPMSSTLIAELHAYGLPLRGPVIRRDDRGDGHLTASAISKIANDHLHSVGVPDTLHALRHRFATLFLRESRDIRTTQEVLGHASPATTAIYTQWSPDDAAAVVERLRFGQRVRAET